MIQPSIEAAISKVRSASDIPSDTRDAILKDLQTFRVIDTDPWIYRFVVLFLGFAVLLTVAGGIWLTNIGGSSANYQIPQGIVAIGSAAVGALAGLLAPSPRQG